MAMRLSPEYKEAQRLARNAWLKTRPWWERIHWDWVVVLILASLTLLAGWFLL